jgi:hypothetical protein
MIILLQSLIRMSESGFEAGLQRAFNVLGATQVRVLGGGRFADGAGYVVLRDENDTSAALTALIRLGIAASRLRPTTSPKPAPLRSKSLLT